MSEAPFWITKYTNAWEAPLLVAHASSDKQQETTSEAAWSGIPGTPLKYDYPILCRVCLSELAERSFDLVYKMRGLPEDLAIHS